MEGIWKALITELNKREIGLWITRKDLMGSINKPQSAETIDVYRRLLTKAGYLETVGRGVYKRVLDIHSDLTIERAKEIPNLLEDMRMNLKH